MLREIKENPPQLMSRFFQEGISLSENILFSNDGYIYVRDASGKLVKRTTEKFFIHHKLSKEEASEALRRLGDVLLLKKLEDGKLEARDIVRCRNVRIREFLLQRYGFEKFAKELNCKIIHKDGENELLRVSSGEEPIMMVKVRDPSTGRFHIIRVPPTMKTCREAIAWTFGMAEEEYKPIKET